jgi:guanylate kinase
MDDLNDKEIQLTACQQDAFKKMLQFIKDENAKIFILKGYAGTGKTTMLRKLIVELEMQNENFSLLASTGRAAKIVSNATGRNTRTVHGEIYKFTDLNQNLEQVASDREKCEVDATGQLFLNFELTPKRYLSNENNIKKHYYIVDEASMISDVEDKTATQAMFGSGRLLKDLIK